jgi:hsp70-interacting protein
MDSLLRWSIEHSTPRSVDAPPPVRNNIDPEIIDHILGKSDAVLMKDAIKIALDQNLDEGARTRALENLEMLVEQIDNANGMRMIASPGLETYRRVLRPR